MLPTVYAWREDEISNLQCKADWTRKINCDSIADVCEWAEKFSGNHRLPNDVGMPLERCAIGIYQIGYLFDYLNMDRKSSEFRAYMSEGLASILLHIIASYEMTNRCTVQIQLISSHKTWTELCKILNCCTVGYTSNEYLLRLFEAICKYQRWILYNHMGRTKRWNEQEFKGVYIDIIFLCCQLAEKWHISLEEGFAHTMEKIQDGEIKRH